MDAWQFDRLARALSSGRTRRQLVTGLGASLLAGLLGAEASAATRKRRTGSAKPHHHDRGNQKHRDEQKPHGEHKPRGATKHHGDQKHQRKDERLRAQATICGKKGTSCCAPPAAACRGNRSCVDGVCEQPTPGSTCPNGQVICKGTCVDLLTDAANCGGCGVACAAGQGCCAGVCTDLGASGTCECQPQCEGRECGPDGCGGLCGFCAGPICNEITCDEANGRCVLTPVPGCCRFDEQCADGNPCHVPHCDATRQTCTFTMAANYTRCGGTNTCLNGDCRTCAPATAGCQVNEQCCDYHAGTGGCAGGRGICCRGEGQPCQTDDTCCTQTCYRTQSGSGGFGICARIGCHPDGVFCSIHGHCCSNNCHFATSQCRPPGA